MRSVKYLCLAGLFILISSCSSNKKNGLDTADLNPTDTRSLTVTFTSFPTLTPTSTFTSTQEAENDWVNRPNFIADIRYQVVRIGTNRLMAFDQSGDPNDPYTLKTYATQENEKWRWDEVVEANHTDVTAEVQGVQVGVTITIDQSLTTYNPDLHYFNILEGVNLNPAFNNSNGEDSTHAIAYVAAEALYNAWHDNGPANQVAVRKAVSFESFMKMWKNALDENTGWEGLKTTVYADDLRSDGYVSEAVDIVPGDITVVVLDPYASSQIMRRIRPARVTQDRNEEKAGKSMGTHVENGKLVVWMAFPEDFYRDDTTFAHDFALALDRISWGSGSQDYVVDDKLFDRAADIGLKRLTNILPGNNTLTAFELIPQFIATTTPAPTPVLTFQYDSEDHSPAGIYAVLIKKIRDTATFMDDGTNIADALKMQFSIVNECSRATCYAFDDEGTLHILHTNEEVSVLKSQNKNFVLLQTPMELIDVQIMGYLYNGWRGFNHRLSNQGIRVDWQHVPTEWMPGAGYYLSFDLLTQDQIISEWLPTGDYYISVTSTGEIFQDIKDIPFEYYGSKDMMMYILPHSLIPHRTPLPAASPSKTP